MEVTELGMVILFSPVQPEKAELPMEVTELGMVVFLQPATNVLLAVSMIALQLFLESYTVLLFDTIMLVSPEQPANAAPPIEVTELGMVILFSPVQPEKAE